MNAHARVLVRHDPGEIRAGIAHLAARHGNAESGREAAAIAAARDGRAAFWTTARYHNAAACRFVLAANDVGLDLALAYHVDAAHPLTTAAALLATLVPLNPPAAAALAAARAEPRRITDSVPAG